MQRHRFRPPYFGLKTCKQRAGFTLYDHDARLRRKSAG
jgi:hypothetical protein